MIAVDTHVLVYAHREDSPFHRAAFTAIRALAEGQAAWSTPWPCLHEFFSIVTHPRIYDPPTPQSHALDQIEAWLESPSLVLLAESQRHWQTLKTMIESGRIRGPRVHDARIAALCQQHGVRELWSADRDFTRFSGVTVSNPCIE